MVILQAIEESEKKQYLSLELWKREKFEVSILCYLSIVLY